MLKIGTILLVLCAPLGATGAIFDAADFIEPKEFTAGTVGEIYLDNPSSEGFEIRLKYGTTANMNSQLLIGLGSGNRKFRVGAQNNLTIFPDIEGQMGVALVVSTVYLRREDRGVFNAFFAPMIHEEIPGESLDWNVFVALPLSLELDSGRYFTGAILIIGAIADFDGWFLTGELGLGMGAEQSYLAIGGGLEF